MKKAIWMVVAALASLAFLAAGFEIGARSVGPVERLEASGLVIDGGPIRPAAKWRM